MIIVEDRKEILNKKISHIYELMFAEEYDKALKACDYFLLENHNYEKIVLIKSSILKSMGRLKEAPETIESCCFIVRKKQYLFQKMRIFCCLEKYDDALELRKEIFDNYELTEQENLELVSIDLSILAYTKKENIDDIYFGINDMYLYRQLSDYNYSRAAHYIKECNNKEWNFSKKINEKIVVARISRTIDINKRTPDVIYDIYYIYHPECGTINNKVCNYLKVYTNKGTNQITKLKPILDNLVPKEKVLQYKTSDIVKFLKDDRKYNEALKECDNYLRNHGNDEEILLLKIDILINIGMLNEALDVLEKNSFNSDNVFYYVEKFKLYCSLNRYEEALEIGNTIKERYNIDSNELNKMMRIILFTLDKDEYSRKYNSHKKYYYEAQMDNYNENRAIDYVITENNKNKKSGIQYFDNDYACIQIFNDVKNRMDTASKVPNFMYDTYYFNYKNCGYFNGIICDYVKVSTIKGTKNIVGLAPVPEPLPLNNKIINEENKQNDRIKRFNRRFNKSKK